MRLVQKQHQKTTTTTTTKVPPIRKHENVLNQSSTNPNA
jgi:hypothetical protein